MRFGMFPCWQEQLCATCDNPCHHIHQKCSVFAHSFELTGRKLYLPITVVLLSIRSELDLRLQASEMQGRREVDVKLVQLKQAAHNKRSASLNAVKKLLYRVLLMWSQICCGFANAQCYVPRVTTCDVPARRNAQLARTADEFPWHYLADHRICQSAVYRTQFCRSPANSWAFHRASVTSVPCALFASGKTSLVTIFLTSSLLVRLSWAKPTAAFRRFSAPYWTNIRAIISSCPLMHMCTCMLQVLSVCTFTCHHNAMDAYCVADILNNSW